MLHSQPSRKTAWPSIQALRLRLAQAHELPHLPMLWRADVRKGKRPVAQPEHLRLLFQHGRRHGGVHRVWKFERCARPGTGARKSRGHCPRSGEGESPRLIRSPCSELVLAGQLSQAADSPASACCSRLEEKPLHNLYSGPIHLAAAAIRLSQESDWREPRASRKPESGAKTSSSGESPRDTWATSPTQAVAERRFWHSAWSPRRFKLLSSSRAFFWRSSLFRSCRPSTPCPF